MTCKHHRSCATRLCNGQPDCRGIDYAHKLRDLSDFPDAAKIVLVRDNLNTRKAASLYEASPAAAARRLVERFEWHYTPNHGSWLNMADSELGVLASQCLDRRIADKHRRRSRTSRPRSLQLAAAWITS